MINNLDGTNILCSCLKNDNETILKLNCQLLCKYMHSNNIIQQMCVKLGCVNNLIKIIDKKNVELDELICSVMYYCIIDGIIFIYRI